MISYCLGISECASTGDVMKYQYIMGQSHRLVEKKVACECEDCALEEVTLCQCLIAKFFAVHIINSEQNYYQSQM